MCEAAPPKPQTPSGGGLEELLKHVGKALVKTACSTFLPGLDSWRFGGSTGTGGPSTPSAAAARPESTTWQPLEEQVPYSSRMQCFTILDNTALRPAAKPASGCSGFLGVGRMTASHMLRGPPRFFNSKLQQQKEQKEREEKAAAEAKATTSAVLRAHGIRERRSPGVPTCGR